LSFKAGGGFYVGICGTATFSIVGWSPYSLPCQDTLSCSSAPTALCLLPLARQAHLQAHKLALVLEVQRQGWVEHYLVSEHRPGDERKFLMEMSVRSKLYFVCLLRADEIFQSGVDVILGNMPEQYYKCLLDAQVVERLRAYALEDVRRMQNKHFSAILKDKDVPPLPAVGDALVRDDDLGDDVADEDRDDVLARLDGDGYEELDQEAVVGPVFAGVHLAIALPPIEVLGHTIKFDLMSHTSGVQRAYIQCKHHLRCFKYRQLNLDPDRETMLTYMLAWALAGDRVVRDEHKHALFWPSPDELTNAGAAVQAL
jgi:hypothetical protein